MINWRYLGVGWLDVYTSSDARCMITRHPRHHRGYFVLKIDGVEIARANTLELAKWKAHNHLEGVASVHS